MARSARLVVFLFLALNAFSYAQQAAQASRTDIAKHKMQFVTVQPGVKLEVLDYGGSGSPMIFLAALGPNAHDWDNFAPKFADKYHVYAISRRGFGASDVPAPTGDNYGADRLGDDVLAVMETLKLEQPILVGWSVGGEELSSVGSRFPQKVKALIYLDAAYPYAFYNRAEGEPLLDRAELRRLLEQATRENPVNLDLERKLLTSIAQNEEEIRKDIGRREKATPPPVPKPANEPPNMSMPPMPPQMIAIMTNGVKYTNIPVPILAIFAVPVDLSMIKDPVQRAKMEKENSEFRMTQANAFEAGLPNAHVVRIAHAGHDVFATNENDVIREMTTFLNSLNKSASIR